MTLADIKDSYKGSIGEYAAGKTWYWYLPLWLFGLYVLVKLFSFSMVDGMAGVLMVPYSFDFMLHEIAHIATAFLPAILTAAAGSGSELLLGTGLVLGALWFRNYFALLFCCLWFDLTAQSAGAYMADAIPQQIPLVSLGGAMSGQDPVHDWHFIFGQLHLLGASAFIGNSLRFVGHVVGLFGVVFAAWMMYKMAAAASAAPAAGNITVDHPRPNTLTPPEHPGGALYPTPTRGTLAEHHAPSNPDGTKPPGGPDMPGTSGAA